MLLSILTFISPAIILLALSILGLLWFSRLSREVGYDATGLTLFKHFTQKLSLKEIESTRENVRLSDQESKDWLNIVDRLRKDEH